MGEFTEINWCDSTFSPWVGCTKVSAACDNCYAESWAKRSGSPDLWEGERRRTSAALWKGPLKWQVNSATFRLVHGHRQRVFCASLADVFDNQVPPLWREDLWTLIRRCPDLDWLLLTKRPQNIAKMLPFDWTDEGYPNVWLGMTAENQEEYDRRYDALSHVPVRVRFISYEPALGPLRIAGFGPRMPGWVIAGGESGPKARPASIQWFRELRDECALNGIPFLFKQFGEWAPAGAHASGESGRFAFGDYEHDRTAMMHVDNYPRQFTQFGARSVLERVGKVKAGRLLDGVEHNGFPAAG